MKIDYVVEGIETRYNRINLKLRKFFPPRPPEPQKPSPPPPDPLETFIPKTEGEKFAIDLLKTLRKLGLDPLPRHPDATATFRSHPIIEATVDLTKEEYKELGKPGLGQRIEFDLTKTEE